MGPSQPCEVRGLRPWVFDVREVYLRPRSRVPPDSVVGTTRFFVGKLLSVVGKRQFCEGELLGFGGLGCAIASLRVGLDGILIEEGGRGGRAFADLRTGEVASKARVDTTKSAKRHEGGKAFQALQAQQHPRAVLDLLQGRHRHASPTLHQPLLADRSHRLAK